MVTTYSIKPFIWKKFFTAIERKKGENPMKKAILQSLCWKSHQRAAERSDKHVERGTEG